MFQDLANGQHPESVPLTPDQIESLRPLVGRAVRRYCEDIIAAARARLEAEIPLEDLTPTDLPQHT